MDMKDFFKKFRFENPVIYSTNASIEWSVTDKFRKMSIKITPAIDGASKGRPQKGVKKYDYDKTVFFSLEIHECWTLLSVYDKLVKGDFNLNDKNEKNRGKLVFTHFSNETPNYLIIEPSKEEGSITGGLRLGIVKNKGGSCGFQLTAAQTKRFMAFVGNCAKNLDFTGATFSCLKAMVNMNIADIEKGSSGEQNKSYSKKNNEEYESGSDNDSGYEMSYSDSSVDDGLDLPF